MSSDLRVAIVGLDTSHAIEFPRLMQSPDLPAASRVAGLQATTCLRFETPFQNAEGLDKRQKQLESWGVKVTTRFEDAVAGCDALMLEINDPAFHWEYFQKCAGLGKPIFLDKPVADTLENGRRIAALAESKGVKVFSSSSLRFVPELEASCALVGQPRSTCVYGALGKAPAGSSIVWYGVHAMEMLNRAMGNGAVNVSTVRDPAGVTAVVAYPEGRRGIVELSEGLYQYGGCLRSGDKAAPFVVDMSRAYACELRQVEAFFRTGRSPIAMQDSLEVMALLEATEKSVREGRPISL